MIDLKSEAVNFLFSRTDKDKSAARMLEDCNIEVRLASDPPASGTVIDVLIHAEHDLTSQLHKNDFAGRIENALRESAGQPVRHMQWVESTEDMGPRPGHAVGDPDTDSLGKYHGREGERVRKADPGKTGDYNTQRAGDSPVIRRHKGAR